MMGMDFAERTMGDRDRRIVVTGGAGALGTAVVGALLDAGAVCHVPCRSQAEAERFALRQHAGVKLSAPVAPGKAIKCPKCGAAIRAPAESGKSGGPVAASRPARRRCGSRSPMKKPKTSTTRRRTIRLHGVRQSQRSK